MYVDYVPCAGFGCSTVHRGRGERESGGKRRGIDVGEMEKPYLSVRLSILFFLIYINASIDTCFPPIFLPPVWYLNIYSLPSILFSKNSYSPSSNFGQVETSD